MALGALLFRPVQRMCVYPLLFKQELKFTADGSQLHTRFEQARLATRARRRPDASLLFCRRCAIGAVCADGGLSHVLIWRPVQ